MIETPTAPGFAPPELAAFPDHYVTVNGNAIRYKEGGTATHRTPLVLAHGFLGTLNDWRYVMPMLAAESGRRVIAFDWPGFGRSDKPADGYSLSFYAETLAGLLHALGIERATIAAHSMGGKYALTFAILYPAMLDKLVLVATDGFGRDPRWYAITAATPLGGWSIDLIGNPRLLRASYRNIFADPAFYPTEAETQAVAAQLRDPVYRAALVGLNKNYAQISLRATGMIARVGEISAPTLIAWGDKDRVLGTAQAALVYAAIPHSRLVWFPGAGHFPQVERAAAFCRTLLDFVA